MALIQKLKNLFRRPDAPMQRWTSEELRTVKAYLENLPPAEFALADWVMVTDYLVHRYLPANDQRTEASWQRTRANLRARVITGMGDAHLPPRPPQMPRKLPPDPVFDAWLETLQHAYKPTDE